MNSSEPKEVSLDVSFKTPERTQKIEEALSKRQPGLVAVIENVHDPHNFNAILRSCDAVGVMRCMMIYTIEHPPRGIATSSSGAYKWIERELYTSVEACYSKLKSEGFQILATKIEPKARSLFEYDLTVPTAIVMGNEHRGISEEAAKGADGLLYIPMMGMTESVNVSVATAVCLFEALRQRKVKGMYDAPQLSPEALRSKRLEWFKK